MAREKKPVHRKRLNFGRQFLWQVVVFYFQIKKYPGYTQQTKHLDIPHRIQPFSSSSVTPESRRAFTSGFHGVKRSNSSSDIRLFGCFSSNSFRYWQTFTPFAFAFSTIVQMTALVSAPAWVSLNSHPLRPTTNGRIAFSLSYPHMRITKFIRRIFLSSSFAKDSINQSIFQ